MTSKTKTLNLILRAKQRVELGKKVKILRDNELIPAVSYGAGQKTQNLTLNLKEFKQIFREAGESTLVSLKVDDSPARKVLISDTQFDPITDTPIHVDLKLIRMDEKIKTEVPLKFIGESKAVLEMDGTLVTNKDEVEIECLPDDLVSEIEIDISPLVDFENRIRISDLSVPENIKILDDPEETVALIQEPRSEEELAELEEKPEEDVEKVEVEEKAKEEEEIAEGEGGSLDSAQDKEGKPASQPVRRSPGEEGSPQGDVRAKTPEPDAKKQGQTQQPQKDK